VRIDTDGDGSPDYATPGTTSGFAPGWWRSTPTNPPIPVKVSHNGPHPTWPLPPPPPPPPCTKVIASAIASFEAQADDAVISSRTNAEDVTILSSIDSAGQKLTLVEASDRLIAVPCSTTIDGVAYLVAKR
jgi:hypothetical protein